MKTKLLFVSLLVGLSVPASGALISNNYDFTASFDLAPFPTVGPLATVSGSVGTVTDSSNGNISLTFLNLSILGHIYTLAESAVMPFGNTILFGATVNGITVIVPGTDDFGLGFNPFAGPPFDIDPFASFAYASPNAPGSGFIARRVTVSRTNTVPDSANSLCLLLCSVLGLAGLARRFPSIKP